ncbi:RNA recognition motif domain-containing protein [Pseudocnuella soli]|uniref:RNA recognition motif domain-containing protein n=1 Tax=Pseudocnuella soli TaxID=2502779 RepID=UPI00104EE50B|nr:RNA-binding protein [Pseudocnuella soli]
MNIHVSNFGTQLQDEDLKNLFTPFGEVTSAQVAIDGFTDQSRGFGYVEMPDDDQARAAIAALNQTQVNGATIALREVAPREVHKGSYKVGTGPVNPFIYRKR